MSNPKNNCSDATIQLLQNRRMSKMFNIPPTRVDTFAKSPYVQSNPATGLFFTQPQLDMRRKVEILKYAGNQSNTKTNAFTRAEKYAQVINGSYASRTYSKTYLDENTIPGTNRLATCPQLPTPSTSCDIPGPMITLYEDPDVPLYMFQSRNVDSYGIQNTVATDIWIISTSNHISFTSYNPALFLSLQLMQNIPQSSYIYTIHTPIAITITGRCSSQIQNPANNVARLNSAVKVKVYYSGQLVKLAVPPIITFTNTNLSMTIDINNNGGNGFLADNSVFSATQYIGMMTISNLFLYTSNNYNYQIYLEFDVNLDNYTNFGTEQPTLGVIANYTGGDIQTNTIIQPQTVAANTGFSIIGI